MSPRPSGSLLSLPIQRTSRTRAPAGKGFAHSGVDNQDGGGRASPSAPSGSGHTLLQVSILFLVSLFQRLAGTLALPHIDNGHLEFRSTDMGLETEVSLLLLPKSFPQTLALGLGGAWVWL